MIRRLDWDSDFLGLEVGATDSNSIDFSDFFDPSFDLVYIFSDQPLNIPDSGFKNCHVSFVDEKITYHKAIQMTQPNRIAITSLASDFVPDEKLINLAFQSGVYSRFNVDQDFPKDKFKQLYRLWLINSINRQIAEEVFIFQTNSDIAGVITAGIKNGIPDIGIIAVDEKYRGQNIGKSLINAVENWAVHTKKMNQLQVVTQGANVPACNFYERTGFTIAKRQYIYHCWKKNK